MQVESNYKLGKFNSVVIRVLISADSALSAFIDKTSKLHQFYFSRKLHQLNEQATTISLFQILKLTQLSLRKYPQDKQKIRNVQLRKGQITKINIQFNSYLYNSGFCVKCVVLEVFEN